MSFYFYSIPESAAPSPYFFSFRKMLNHLSRKGIMRFKLWQGSHEAPIPIEEDVEGQCIGEGA